MNHSRFCLKLKLVILKLQHFHWDLLAPPGFVIPNDQQKCYPAAPVTDPAPTVVTVQAQQAPPTVIFVGGCPKCHVSSYFMEFEQ